MAITTAASWLGTSAFSETPKVELRPNWTEEEAQVAIRAIYRQLLGNEHLMNSERLTSAESLLCDRSITVRDFVRCVAKSELYKSKFFYNNFQNRFTELNYKHLLGRAPYDQTEVAFHNDLYHAKGYDADIDSYIDSDEYRSFFGDNIVPYYRGFETQPGQKTVGFNRMFQLYRGYANSDRSQGQKQGWLTWDMGKNLASPVRTPSSGTLTGTTSGGRSGRYRVRVVRQGSRVRPQVRKTTTEFVVSYDQLSGRLQQIARSGGKVMSVTEV
ncbi:phycobilisome linker polypeptide [Oscillatoriales cyanobacterium LEGE 11467]|uniref:Phycobilisome linker polypeptide n=1 Tax=Zarconia navalis LEGE 11467 TaxID=1828826 RepID=A0A928VZR2_9CYAN|nr:phycobilisome linker polypeptide [Zarconia navalis]MBE9040655.1 phycobilisome linker polypeptide [Zarconia navalis LEGE 11467]